MAAPGATAGKASTAAESEARHRAAYTSRESASTRNPHSAAKPSSAIAQELAKMSPEERVLAQWRAAYGCPISDEAKAQFGVEALGRTFRLSDVRLWQYHHPQRGACDKDQGKERGVIYLEFFFDGSTDELTGQEEVFTKAFEDMVERQLQERRQQEFRQRLAARRRGRGGETAEASAEDGGGGGNSMVCDEAWQAYLKKPLPATELCIRSMREAGCMLRFLVCQTSLSVSASEVLGQIAFQEHFPIDGVPQELPKSTKPLPRWVYGLMVCTAGLTVISTIAWWQVVKTMAFAGGAVVPEAALG